MLRFEGRVEQMLVGLIEGSIPAIVGQDREHEGAHGAIATGTSLALEERGHASRGLVLDDCADGGVIETDLQGGRRDDDVR
ncbi:hypothetical protein D3C86_1828870 [compost metagenome]